MAVFLGLLLGVSVFSGLTLLNMRENILRANYYAGVLDEIGFYEFLMTEGINSALDETMKGEPLIPEPIGVSNHRLSESVYRVFPPEWAQTKMELVLNEVGRYVTGEVDSFRFTISVADRRDAAVSEIKVLLRESELYDFVMTERVEPEIIKFVFDRLPPDTGIEVEEVIDAGRRTLNKGWAERQADLLIDSTSPYLFGDVDSFHLNIPVRERMEQAVAEAKDLLRDTSAYDMIYASYVDRGVTESLDTEIESSYGVVLTSREVKDALSEAVSTSWLQAQVEQAIDDATPFIIGDSDSFVSTMDISDVKIGSLPIMESIVSRKLAELRGDLPRCPDELSYNELIFMVRSGRLDCSPADSLYFRVAPEISEVIARDIYDRLIAPMPDTMTLSEADLYQSVEHTDRVLIEDVRMYARDGWTYTETDLERDLAMFFPDVDDPVGDLENIRQQLEEGWIFTDRDFRISMSHSGRVQLDRDRRLLDIVRSLAWMIVVVPFLAFVVGFVCGRTWASKICWAFTALSCAALLTFALIGPFSTWFLEPYLEGILANLASRLFAGAGIPRTESLATSELLDVVAVASEDVKTGVMVSSLSVCAAAALGSVASGVWMWARGR